MSKDAVRRDTLLRHCRHCCWCGVKLTEHVDKTPWRETDATLDHLRPRGHEERGIGNKMPQTVLACRRCNQLRSQWFEMNVVGIEKLREKSKGSPPADKEKLIRVINGLRKTVGAMRNGLSRILKMAKCGVAHGQIETVAREYVTLQTKIEHQRQQAGGTAEAIGTLPPVSEQIAGMGASLLTRLTTCEAPSTPDADAVRGAEE